MSRFYAPDIAPKTLRSACFTYLTVKENLSDYGSSPMYFVHVQKLVYE